MRKSAAKVAKTNDFSKFLSTMQYLNIIVCGIFMGAANVVPGLSGGTISVITNKYERLVSAVGNLIPNIKNKNWQGLKEDLKFLLPYLLGILIGILVFAVFLSFVFEKYLVATCFSFMGLILGTLPGLFSEANAKEKPKAPAYIAFFITLVLSLVLAYFKIFGDFKQIESIEISLSSVLLLSLYGFVAAGTMIIPGISGSLVLMLMGGYKLVLIAVATILDFSIFWHNVGILLPFAIGVAVGFFVFSWAISKLLEKFYVTSYYAILGFCIGSIPCLYPNGFSFNAEGIVAIILLVAFAVLSFFLTKIAKKKSN